MFFIFSSFIGFEVEFNKFALAISLRFRRFCCVNFKSDLFPSLTNQYSDWFMEVLIFSIDKLDLLLRKGINLRFMILRRSILEDRRSR